MSDRTVLRLSDSFEHESDIEVKVTMLNINYGYNKELMEVCRPLNEYSWFTSRIRDVKKGKRDMTLEEAVDKVMEEVPEDFLIRPFLIANKAEVKRMCITEYNEEKTMKLTYEEGKEEDSKNIVLIKRRISNDGLRTGFKYLKQSNTAGSFIA